VEVLNAVAAAKGDGVGGHRPTPAKASSRSTAFLSRATDLAGGVSTMLSDPE
jgi:hypothetical protein